MSFTCLEHKHMKFNGVKIINVRYDLYKPFKKPAKHYTLVYMSLALRDS